MFNRVRSQVWRLSWFLKNYRKIKPGIHLIPNVFHGPVTYLADSVVTSNNCDFINDPRFKAAYAAAKATNPGKDFDMPWRVYVVCYLAELVKHLPGDFVECGVYTGAFSRAVIEYTGFSALNKTFYLLDTFDGLVSEQITDKEKTVGIHNYLGNYKNVYERVVKTFEKFPVKIIKGAIPETLPHCEVNQVCYLSIDMNVVEPEIAAANYFWNKIVSGGVIVIDDYGFPMHIEQKKAFDQFAIEKRVNIFCLPTGQGIIFKP